MRLPLLPFLFIFHAAAAAAAPAIVVTSPAYNFGSVEQGKKIEHTFSFTNAGDEALNVGKITSSCGCTAASVSSKSIPPGKTGEIRVVFDSTNFSGPIKKTVTFETNDPKKNNGTLTLSGTVAEVLSVRPTQLSVPALKAGAKKEVTVTIRNSGEKDVAIISVSSQTPQIYAAAKGKTVKPGQSLEISIGLTPKEGDRRVNGYVTVKTDSQAKPEIRIPVFGTVGE
jgi:copper(I)-binding protein